MARGFSKALRWLRRQLMGRKFNKALERHQRAAEELDKAVREVLEA